MTRGPLIEQFGLTGRGVISIIGAGGKTSLMFRLAKDLAGFGKQVLTTTTTKIFTPRREDSPEIIFAESMDALFGQVKSHLAHYSHFSAGSRYDPNLKKVIGLPPEMIDQLWQTNLFDWIIIEADGAKRKPLKATGSHEPVVPSHTTHLILVAGLDAIGLVLNDDHVHRAHLFSRKTGLALGEIVDERSMATVIAIEVKKAGASFQPEKSLVVLNKADTEDKIASGRRIKKMLIPEKIVDEVIVTSLISRQAS